MNKDTKIYRNNFEFKQFQPLICTNVELSFGTTLHFDMNGFINTSYNDDRLGISSLWINADYWYVYYNEQLKFDSNSIDINSLKALKKLFLKKKFVKLKVCRKYDYLLIIFENIEIKIIKPANEVYDLINIFLPDGKIFYYSDDLYKSYQLDEDRYSAWKEIPIDNLPLSYLEKLKNILKEYLNNKKEAYIRFGITGNIKKLNSQKKIQPNFQIETDNQLLPFRGFKLTEDKINEEYLSKKYPISEIYAI